MKIDCNITQNYMNEQQRMCEFYKDCHEGCPAYYICNSVQRRELDMISIVQAWSDSHHQKTYLEDFEEKYPNAPKANDGTPMMCPKKIGFNDASDCHEIGGCVECWSQLI